MTEENNNNNNNENNNENNNNLRQELRVDFLRWADFEAANEVPAMFRPNNNVPNPPQNNIPFAIGEEITREDIDRNHIPWREINMFLSNGDVRYRYIGNTNNQNNRVVIQENTEKKVEKTTEKKSVKRSTTSQEKGKKIALITTAFGVLFKKIYPNLIILTDQDRITSQLLSSIDLLIFSGGEDINPSLYGERNNGLSFGVNPERDSFEMPILNWAREHDKHIYGTCRGHQLINVAVGGSLYQDFTSEGLGQHYRTHGLEFDKGSENSIIRKFFEKEMVSSAHHQGVKRVGRYLRQVCTHKGLNEGSESDLIITTQFHPEFDWTPDPNNAANKFFNYLAKEW